jgi:hypothetical protein
MVVMEPLNSILARMGASKQAWALLRQGMKPEEFVAALVEQKEYLSAIDFMAHAMPPRESVWWGCLCLQHAYGENLAPLDRTALQAATVWVVWPTEKYRARAYPHAQAAGMSSPAGALAMAAYLVGVPGPVAVTPANAVANAVKMATTKGAPAKIKDTQRLFVELGVGVAEGRFVWPKA